MKSSPSGGGSGLHAAGVAAGFGFGQREGAELAAVEQARQPLGLLLLGAEQAKCPAPDAMVSVDEDRGAGAVAPQHFHRL
jgi:hypothetical protein